MALEVASYIEELDPLNPLTGDPKAQGDDHLRLLKTVLQTQFAGLGTTPVTVTAAELNQLTDVGSNVPVTLTDASNSWNVGDETGNHLAFDADDIQAKASPTAAGNLSINRQGGTVNIGPQIGSGSVNFYNATVRRAAVSLEGLRTFHDTLPQVELWNVAGTTQYGEFLASTANTYVGIIGNQDSWTFRLFLNDSGSSQEQMLFISADTGTALYGPGGALSANTIPGGLRANPTSGIAAILEARATGAGTDAFVKAVGNGGGASLYWDDGSSIAGISQLTNSGTFVENWMTFTEDGGVVRNFNGAEKDRTTASGVTVTGTLEATGLSVGGIPVTASPVRKFKTAATTRASTTTLTDDPHLASWSLEAGERYVIRAHFTANLFIASDFKFRFNFSNTPVGSQSGLKWSWQSGPSNGGEDTKTVIGNTDTITVPSDSIFSVIFEGFFQANATTGGTLDFQWAQDTSVAENTELDSGSWMSVEKIS